ncbi:MAG: hypothetical protein AAFY06_02380 [Pseudomonadota bacterium]
MQTIVLPDVEIPQDFKPRAVFDVHLDCIRVLTRDTSVCEVRIDEFITIFRDNAPLPGSPTYVGFSLKGVNHLLNEFGFDLHASYKLADIMDAIVRNRPASTMAVLLDLISIGEEIKQCELDFSDTLEIA